MADFIMDYTWVLWLAIGIAFLIAEIMTTSLVSIWFVPSAAIVAIMSIFVNDFIIQIIVFILLSIIFLILCKKYYRPPSKDKSGSANDMLIGNVATTVTEINSFGGTVLVGDVRWHAVCDGVININTKVKIVSVESTTLTVEKMEG